MGLGVGNADLIGRLSCLKCSGKFERKENTLVCTECGESHPIVKDIPRLVPASNYADSFGLQWNIHVKTQLDSHTGLNLTRERLFTAADWPERLEGETILEAGSGAGRFTEILASTGAHVLSFDLSSAVEANDSNNGHNPNLLIFQSRIEAAPIAPASIDKVICLGVIQHTPDPEASFKALAKYVRPGGSLVIDCYPKTLRALLHWKYVMRPFIRGMDDEKLYRFVRWYAPKLVPVSVGLQKIFGRWVTRLIPVLQYRGLMPLSDEQNREWAILDTFDALSPAHDHPQTAETVRQWYVDAGFEDVTVFMGWNGVVARGTKSGGVAQQAAA